MDCDCERSWRWNSLHRLLCLCLYGRFIRIFECVDAPSPPPSLKTDRSDKDANQSESLPLPPPLSIFHLLDWDDSQTHLAQVGGGAPGAAKSGGDKLWEDNWDDDDIEDEFSVQLRYALLFFLSSYFHPSQRPCGWRNADVRPSGF